MISRRSMIQSMAATAGAFGLGMTPGALRAAEGGAGAKAGIKTKRVIFFVQNNGFHPQTCFPKEVTENCSLSEFKLQEHMQPLEPYKDKMHIITGVHGRHCNPGHSAYFGALGGYYGNATAAPGGPTIDHAISQHLPKTVLPHLCIGFGSSTIMKARPTTATLSAAGANQPIFMHSDPNLLYQSIFGSIANDAILKAYNVRSNILRKMESYEANIAKGLASADRRHYGNYVDNLRQMNGVREQLVDMSDTLKKYAPEYDDGYTHPEFETDWHDRLLDIGIAALQANITNVLTIGSGRAGTDGTWEGIGAKGKAHALGHVGQPESRDWVKIRQYNSRMLVKLMKSLEAIPEGNGTMMDNTLIVYTSDAADWSHTTGNNWPFVLLGNGGGHFKTGVYTKAEGRPINDLYATLLRGIGVPEDRFNIEASLAAKLKSQAGPIERLLA